MDKPADGVRYYVAPKEGQTRMCLDPWAKVFIRATGKVCLCCNMPPVGSLEDDTLENILNNQESQQYRQGLLSGNVMPHCRTCPDRQIGDPNDLLRIVKKFLDTGIVELT